MLSRRGLLLGLLATPAIVRAPSLMPISVFRERPLMRVSGLPAIYSNGFVRQFIFDDGSSADLFAEITREMLRSGEAPRKFLGDRNVLLRRLVPIGGLTEFRGVPIEVA